MTRIWSTRYGPYDAVSAIGFFEHVGLSRRSGYIPRVFSLLVNGGRFLNHAISHMPNIKERLSRSGFAGRTCATITSLGLREQPADRPHVQPEQERLVRQRSAQGSR